MNQVVARYQDGRILKGTTGDFLPTKDRFHLQVQGAAPGTRPAEVLLSDLKAVFFVKDFAGHPEHKESDQFDPKRPTSGRKIRVVFKDGEITVGSTQGYQPGRPGFFLVPADPESNNERCFVVTAAAREISLL